ncbi:MAG TPA: molybdopterin-dependent oxidoreductase [Vicinamibacterales bacterium]|nr:molybdopterin-dependent oxidoreductase [Vicinamibacterales bacterium]
MPRPRSPATWGRSTIQTACPLDCPDSCSLEVTVEAGRIVEIDGSTVNPVTGGYICNKVRHFGRRVYGEARLKYPMLRTGSKGSGAFARTTWDEALDRIVARIREVRERWGGEAILPFSYGGSNGLLTQDTTDADLFRRLGASRLARTVCAAPTGAAAQAMYGKMAGVAYPDYEHARLIVIWGANPPASSIHLVPYLKAARRRGARLVVIDPRATALARQADLHLPVRPGTDLPVALALHRYLFESGRADLAFLERHANGVERLRERAREWTFERAADVAGLAPADLARFAEWYAAATPAVIRCGWGVERNRNGGNAVLAILALPAVAGKFGVRGGGYTMSNSAAWGIKASKWIDAPEPPTRLVNMNQLGRALLEYDRPPIQLLFVYNCNPLVTMPDQRRVERGLARDDLFTVVFDQVFTDTARYADVLLPATTFLEHYDVAKGYGAISLQLVRPVVDAVGEARPNPEVFAEIARRLDLGPPAEAEAETETEAETLLRVVSRMPPAVGSPLVERGSAPPPHEGRPIQFVDVFPGTPDGRIDLFPESLAAQAPAGLYGFQPDPATPDFPLALISPAVETTISSTLGELRARPAALDIHPEDARARGIEDGDEVRVFNERGEVRCPARLSTAMRPGTVSLPKGLWCRSTLNGYTANALVPDTLTDLGGGACFNDARVQVARVEPGSATDAASRPAH